MKQFTDGYSYFTNRKKYHTVLFAQKVQSKICLQVSGSKRLSCYADLYTVSRCRSRGEFEDHTSDKAHKKGFIPALKTRAEVTRSPKEGYQQPHEKDSCPPKIFQKNYSKQNLLTKHHEDCSTCQHYNCLNKICPNYSSKSTYKYTNE